MKYLSEEDEQHVAEDFQGPPGASLRFAEARGSAPSEDENYCKAVDNLHEAARDFTKKWLKAPQDSSFTEWFEACETLERAAVEYAKAKAQNDQAQRPGPTETLERKGNMETEIKAGAENDGPGSLERMVRAQNRGSKINEEISCNVTGL